MAIVETTNYTTATAFSNQRKVDRCQNGVIWAVFLSGTVSGMRLSYSTNNGANWSNFSFVADNDGNVARAENHSIFIDQDDYLHVVWKQAGTVHNYTDGYLYYVRGTPNESRTAWTWGPALILNNSGVANHPDVVAHREGAGWRAHWVASWRNNTPVNHAVYGRVNISEAGSVSIGLASTAISPDYATTIDTFPSVDFHHTGDGKTVAGSVPHIYAGWSAGGVGSGRGLRYRKATYTSGSWSWGSEREIDPDIHLSTPSRWFNCVFDGSRVLLGGTAVAPGVARL